MSNAKLLAFRGCMSMEEMPHLAGAMLLYAPHGLELSA